jgi:hypothetical protein
MFRPARRHCSGHVLVRVPPGWPPGLAANRRDNFLELACSFQLMVGTTFFSHNKSVNITFQSSFSAKRTCEKTEEKALSGHAKGRAPLHLPNADDDFTEDRSRIRSMSTCLASNHARNHGDCASTALCEFPPQIDK